MRIKEDKVMSEEIKELKSQIFDVMREIEILTLKKQNLLQLLANKEVEYGNNRK